MRQTMKTLKSLLLAGSIATGACQVFAADSSPTSEMTDQGGGVLKQVATGREWAQSDNGSDINWHAAGKFCADKGPGWRLPSVSELQSIHDKSGQAESSCGAGFACRVSPLFHLTGPWAWSNEAVSSVSAWIVILTKGNTDTYVVADATKKRALCVRSS
jgi:hypothetical protein